jgi:hypothetical protein
MKFIAPTLLHYLSFFAAVKNRWRKVIKQFNWPHTKTFESFRYWLFILYIRLDLPLFRVTDNI